LYDVCQSSSNWRLSGSERDRTGNSTWGGNQRFREFWAEISGCERDLQGFSRTPITLSRNRGRVVPAGKRGLMSVQRSRREIAQRFGITEVEVLRIEREGLDNEWPPL